MAKGRKSDYDAKLYEYKPPCDGNGETNDCILKDHCSKNNVVCDAYKLHIEKGVTNYDLRAVNIGEYDQKIIRKDTIYKKRSR